jgi:hypothetical protein
MHRASERRLSPSLEGLESRNLQSGLSTLANGQLIGLLRPAPQITQPTQNSPSHAYQVVTGFFGE